MRQKCTANKVPWLCCTGAGTGTCGNPRSYVQTASGARPDAVGSAQYGAVELPNAKYVLTQGNGSTAPTTYVRFTNHVAGNDSGRTFYFWWATTGIMQLGNAHHLSFEDFDIAYNSRASAMYGSGAGSEQVVSAARSPWQNPYVERVIGSLRRECTDHVIVTGAAHLHRVLREYVAYYNADRTHVVLDKESPATRPCCRPVAAG